MGLSLREGLVMYWCEGDKSMESRTYRVALTSCDPDILRLFVEWLEKYYNIKKSTMKVRLHLWPDSDEVKAKQYWSTYLEVSLNNFTKTWTKPRGTGIAKPNHNYGICRVSISSKKLLQKILNDIKKEFS
jgi:hypothetical protein